MLYFYYELYQSCFLLINKIARSVLVLILKGLHGIGESDEWSYQFHKAEIIIITYVNIKKCFN
ncbi:hypothetical protein PESP_a1682 [Pseudoalteromonas espejiana DSM 9414]|uniref:Uncharacterized protein n=1 Tax=Pseudoalteromonas espejiana TaxID=28107 RepID=A0A510XUB1_9GAMM|nr:hypothetical protein PESP_a1682 [Pseudoalteromonas espejiana DSM 9414]GEK54167.1 hypothetical protein PES01_10120 [Pseudoalteromonas espejiana]